MNRIVVFAYGIVCYALFFGIFLYLIAFNADAFVAKTVSSGEPGPVGVALAVDLLLIALFGVQHSTMSRRPFKAWLTQFVSPAIERSTYVLATCGVLALIFVLWRPLPGQVWAIEPGNVSAAVWTLNAVGWVLVLVSTFLTNHFDLFGLRQVYLALRGRPYTPVRFQEWLFYRRIRHPMMLGLLIAFWAVPVMTMSHLVFSLGMTAYIFVGIHYEEAALAQHHGDAYRQYQQRTGRLLPFF